MSWLRTAFLSSRSRCMSTLSSIVSLSAFSVLHAKRSRCLISVSIVLCLNIIFFIVSMERHYYIPLALSDTGFVGCVEVTSQTFLDCVRQVQRLRQGRCFSVDVHVSTFGAYGGVRSYYLRYLKQTYRFMYFFTELF